MNQTPSPSDSAVGDLETMLKEKDTEINYLRETMEQNEQVIFKVQKILTNLKREEKNVVKFPSPPAKKDMTRIVNRKKKKVRFFPPSFRPCLNCSHTKWVIFYDAANVS